jgi:structure-specific endonuclease subunit SLX1
MLLVVHGFPTRAQALAFEWAWQHPTASKAVRPAVAHLPRTALDGPAGRVRVLLEMLRLDPWRSFPLSVCATGSAHAHLVPRARAAGGPAPPPHVSVDVEALDVLMTGYRTAGADEEEGGSDGSDAEGVAADAAAAPAPSTTPPTCALCDQPMPDALLPCAACGAACHVSCLGDHFLSLDASGGALPTAGACPACGAADTWVAALGRQGRGGPSAWAARAAKGKARARKPRKVPTLAAASAPTSPAAAGVRKKKVAGAGGARSAPASPAVGRPVPPAPEAADDVIMLSSSSSSDDEEQGAGGEPAAAGAAVAAARVHASPRPLAARLGLGVGGSPASQLRWGGSLASPAAAASPLPASGLRGGGASSALRGRRLAAVPARLPPRWRLAAGVVRALL